MGKNKRTMKDSCGRDCVVSEEIYRLTDDVTSLYKAGTLVRLIGGVDNRVDEPGYHFRADYQTVTRLCANPAEFIGVQKTDLVLASFKKDPQN